MDPKHGNKITNKITTSQQLAEKDNRINVITSHRDKNTSKTKIQEKYPY